MKSPIYAALDLHSRHSVLGSMDHEGNNRPRIRFATTAEMLRSHVAALRQKKRPVYLTMEAGAFTRWASGIVRALVERLIICEPRYNRLINSNPTKSDEADVEGMCLLLRVGKLKEVWMGVDRTREIYRALVYELLNWRDAQRELKALIKARYRLVRTHRMTITTGGLDVARLTWPCRFESGDVALMSPGQSEVTSVNLPSASATVRTVNAPSPVIMPPCIPEPSTRECGTGAPCTSTTLPA